MPEQTKTWWNSTPTSNLTTSLSSPTTARHAHEGKQRYSRPATSLSELTRSELALLTQILRVDLTIACPPDSSCATPSDTRAYLEQNIKELIVQLPLSMRLSRVLRLFARLNYRVATLCPAHRPINPLVIAHIFDLVVREVTVHLAVFNEYPEVLDTEYDVRVAVRDLERVRGMWIKPSPERGMPVGTWKWQANKCEACMLSRIVSDRIFLRQLRVTMLSRTRTRHNHRAPRLLPFIEAAINQHRQLCMELLHESSKRAVEMKRVRKVVNRLHKSTGRRRGFIPEYYYPEGVSSSTTGPEWPLTSTHPAFRHEEEKYHQERNDRSKSVVDQDETTLVLTGDEDIFDIDEIAKLYASMGVSEQESSDAQGKYQGKPVSSATSNTSAFNVPQKRPNWLAAIPEENQDLIPAPLHLRKKQEESWPLPIDFSERSAHEFEAVLRARCEDGWASDCSWDCSDYETSAKDE
ncbi:hypothetical protein ASPZODRAFT_143688 [Penicilliopsis zonata CBS 506.65]|uniref:Uncharacterized protein n=1 Tax=Penicilliopsis zonata CBS 506.65 TaxID=1073090 RepID=A0A1L9SF47_9EURO|nr:hypothetical protein ASPZODRAFT_143688 [Penicilliopsis zonata CBS 506.65]OJJ45811.1 hypothetical protein ASPZODRAFT_143688 [Penicilliopsis zonata CBS 506.65]